jgi:mannose-6-phosphate isomerase-like protein (cupin superfamily)/quinol monooxygenase YgiN
MGQIARHGKMTAREGKAAELAERMLAAAAELESDPGCELYLINRQADDPAVIWVTELWRSQEDLDGAVEKIRGSDDVAAVMELVEDGGMIELDLLGGKGAGEADAEEPPPFSVAKLSDVEDMAAKHGFGETGAARFANEDLDARDTGVSLHSVKPGARQPFGHRHAIAEEVYVVVSGSGRIRLDDEIVEISELDAVRIAPQVVRKLEAGPDGLEVLAFGPRHRGEAEMLTDFWTD